MNSNNNNYQRGSIDENATAISAYVREARKSAGNPQKTLNTGLFGKHNKARTVAFDTRKKYELEKNAAKKEALLENVKKADAELNSLANALNANANADYPYLEEYEGMINRDKSLKQYA